MAKPHEHIEQVKKNLAFLEFVNNNTANHFDWQVTIAFYTAVHLVNAHLSYFGLQYLTHNDTKRQLNPLIDISLGKIPAEPYQAYIGLGNLSRRSRYLVNIKDPKSNVAMTYEKHLSKAIRNLDTLLFFFTDKYKWDIPTVVLKSTEVSNDQLKYLKIVKP